LTNATIALEDRIEIEALIHRFYWLVDHGKADETADLFAPTARLTFGPGSPKPGTVEGPDIKSAMLARSKQVNVTTRHVLSCIALAARPDGMVDAYSLLTLFRSEDEGRDTYPASVADIEEIMVRIDGKWRVQERIILPIFHRAVRSF
jgi:hypothetical protein